MQKRKSLKSSYNLYYALANFLLTNSLESIILYSYYYKAKAYYIISPNYFIYYK